METKETRGKRFEIEKLEQRIAPALVWIPVNACVQGESIQLPTREVVPAGTSQVPAVADLTIGFVVQKCR